MKADTLEWALSYVQGGGLSVVPLRPNDKRPAIPSWERFQHERPTADELTSWFGWGDNNLGIVTGEISGLVVVDLDGDDGERSYNELGWPTLNETAGVVTWSGGVHVFFRHPGGKVGNRVKMRPGLDVRGDGGYVVAPPSVIDGGQYDWLTPVRPVLPLPGVPHEELPAERPRRFPRLEKHGTGYAAAALRNEAQAVAGAAEGARNDTLNRAAYSLGRLVKSGDLSRADAESVLRDAALAAGLSEHEIAGTIRSGLDSR